MDLECLRRVWGFMAGISETPVVFEMHRMVGTTIGLSYLPSHGCLVVLGSGKPIIQYQNEINYSIYGLLVMPGQTIG